MHHSDDEAFALWQEIAGLPAERIYRLGDKDNFWQMADTGPCGPCTEIYVDLAKVATDFRVPGRRDRRVDATSTATSSRTTRSSRARRRAGSSRSGTSCSCSSTGSRTARSCRCRSRRVDTGAGLERIAAVKQGVTNNFHTDVFAPLHRDGRGGGRLRVLGPRERRASHRRADRGGRGGADVVPNAVDPASFRVLADHARAVAFLLADGVFPSNEGRGYVLRRILRRAVRHAWLLGRREPTLVHVVQAVIDTMGDVYPELRHARASTSSKTTRVEEQAFLATIEGGLARFEQLAPAHTTQGSTPMRGTISGEDAFRLYDTFGFPIDLTELMAHERGYTVDIAGLRGGARRSSARGRRTSASRASSAWRPTSSATSRRGSATRAGDARTARFVGYDAIEVETHVAALRRLDGDRVAMLLRESPFYAESGGQVSDEGEIVGDGWRVDVDGVRKVDGRSAALGAADGRVPLRAGARRACRATGAATRSATTPRRTCCTPRCAQVLGEHVHQAGSLVAPDRLRFDFTHHGPVTPRAARARSRRS